MTTDNKVRFNGLVRANERCHVGGFKYGPGQVIEVNDIVLWSDDPFEAVAFDGFDGEAARYVRINPPVYEASERMAPEHRIHAGLRRPRRLVHGLWTEG